MTTPFFDTQPPRNLDDTSGEVRSYLQSFIKGSHLVYYVVIGCVVSIAIGLAMVESPAVGLGSVCMSSVLFSPLLLCGFYIKRRNRQLVVNGNVVEGLVIDHEEITIGSGTRRNPNRQVWSFLLQYTRPDNRTCYARMIHAKSDQVPERWRIGSVCKLLLHPTSGKVVWCVLSDTALCKVEVCQKPQQQG